jgi:hypothetical protein
MIPSIKPYVRAHARGKIMFFVLAIQINRGKMDVVVRELLLFKVLKGKPFTIDKTE